MGTPRHGQFGTRIYRIWNGIKSRCQNKNAKDYERYGGRGIAVCEEWQAFEPFYEWAMANGYRDDLSIDRIDNDGNYCPENCRWTTVRKQSRNRRSNRILEYNGVKKCLSEWDESVGAKTRGVVRQRLVRGWSIEKAVTTPVTNNKY